jgi:DNA-binding CsgD family transcriptional regulator
MKPEAKAEIFKQALASNGGDVVAAFLATEKAAHPATKMPPARVDQLRAERARGRTLLELAAEFGITESYASTLCRGVRRAAAVRTLSPLGLEVVRIVGEVLFTLPPGWERLCRRGRPPGSIGLAQRAAVVSMRGQGLTNQQIGDIMGGRGAAAIAHIAWNAREDISVRQLATLVGEILVREAPSVVYALPPLTTPLGAAA